MSVINISDIVPVYLVITEHIQYYVVSSLKFSTVYRSHSSSPSSSAVSSSSRYQKQLSAAVAYAKLMQEKSGTNLMNSQLLFQHELQETQRLLEEQQVIALKQCYIKTTV